VDDDSRRETRQERREKRRRKERDRIPQHGKSLARVYRDAVLKRLRRKAE
jgi:hypothetical protein